MAQQVERSSQEEMLQKDINRLKDPERHKGMSVEIGSLQQAIDIIERLRQFVAADQGGDVAWKQLKHAMEPLEQELTGQTI